MNWSDTDVIRMAAYFAAIFLTPVAEILLCVELLMELAYYFTDSGFQFTLAQALTYCTLATINIKLKSEIRQLLLLIGLINYLAAVDYLLAPDYETYFFICYPWIINALDLLILFHLMPKGGLSFVVGIISPSSWRIARL